MSNLSLINSPVLVFSMQTKMGKVHLSLKKYVGRVGIVQRIAKNGMFLVVFGNQQRSIPQSCVIGLNQAHYVLGKQAQTPLEKWTRKKHDNTAQKT